ncbi:MAG: transglycosylase domain-containing protein [Hyphomicrobiales bacterium]|nr:transglycosylase domain-containing protein [Hyphomicrobiales bacterium]
MTRWLRRALRIATGLLLLPVVAIAVLMAVWAVKPPVSTLMLARYALGERVERDYAPLDRIAPALVASVIMSEDGQFCRHDGVDWGALHEVIEDSDEDGPSRGASTITMQTVKNLFLWPGRSVIRKGLEIPLALALDALWTKRRIIEVYLNIAEWGPDGTFGAEAAARADFGRSAAALTLREASLMATALPNPVKRLPGRPKPGHSRLAGIIAGRVARSGPWLDCLRK